MALQSNDALAEIRDSLLNTYAINDAMNQLILKHLDARAWRAQLPGQKASGRTVASIFAHLHNCRLKWLKKSAPHLKCPPPLNPHRCTKKQAAAALKKSAAQCQRMLADALSSRPESPRHQVHPRQLDANLARHRHHVRLHLRPRSSPSRPNPNARPPARPPPPRIPRPLALGKTLETNRPNSPPRRAQTALIQARPA